MLLKFVLRLLVVFLIRSEVFAQSEPFFAPEVSLEVRNQLFEDLKFLQGIKGAAETRAYLKVFGEKFDGAGLYRFFVTRISEIGTHDCGGNPYMAACVIPELGSSRMYLTRQYSSLKIPQVYRISILIHEARHAETAQGSWLHSNCPVPFLNADLTPVVGIFSKAKLEGQPACDDDLLGSYGVQALMLKNIGLFCSNCTAQEKSDAMRFAADTTVRITDAGAKLEVDNSEAYRGSVQ